MRNCVELEWKLGGSAKATLEDDESDSCLT